MRPLVALLFICMVLPKAASSQLSCYTCNAPKCDKNENRTCTSDSNFCYTAPVLNKNYTLRGCGTEQICNKTQPPMQGVDVRNVTCCQGNLCNGAERFTLSFLLMFFPLLFSSLVY